MTRNAAAHSSASDRSAISWAGTMKRWVTFRKALRSVARSETAQSVANALQPLGFVLAAQGDLASARRCYEEAIVLAQEIGDKREIATALNNRAQLHRLQGELDAAQRLFEEVLTLVQELEDHEDIAITLLNLAMIGIGRGALDGARGMLLETLSIIDSTGSKWTSQSVFEVSAGLANRKRSGSKRPASMARPRPSRRTRGINETRRTRLSWPR